VTVDPALRPRAVTIRALGCRDRPMLARLGAADDGDALIAGVPDRHPQRIEETIAPFRAKGILFQGCVDCFLADINRQIHSAHLSKPGLATMVPKGSLQVGPLNGQPLTRITALVDMLSRWPYGRGYTRGYTGCHTGFYKSVPRIEGKREYPNWNLAGLRNSILPLAMLNTR